MCGCVARVGRGRPRLPVVVAAVVVAAAVAVAAVAVAVVVVGVCARACV